MRGAISLDEKTGRAVSKLGREIEKAAVSTEPVSVKLPDGVPSLESDEIVVLVLSRRGVLASVAHVEGREVEDRDVRLSLAGATVAVESLLREGTASAPALSGKEAAVLDEAGLTEKARGVGADAVGTARIELEVLLLRSLPLEAAAKLLGVSPSRLRQRLGARTLYGIKEKSGWRLPRFQFGSNRRLVRGIEEVLPHVRVDAHPVAVARWFAAPHQDLVLGAQEQPVSPLQWLSAGHPPRTVAALAEEL